MPAAPSHAASGHGDCDVFLHVQTKRAGKVKGEARSTGHTDDIVVAGWHWGLSSSSAIGSTMATSRRSYTALTVIKGIDSATTALMSALATNDEVKEAKLTMRKAGGDQEDFFVITLKGARITALSHEADSTGDTRETLAITFTEVEVEYRNQRGSGQRGASTMFNDAIATNN
jgi:type VI secretion system secreted protein Hcp